MTFIIIKKDGKGQQIERSILRPVENEMPNFRADKEANVKLEHPEELCSDAIFGSDDEIESVPIITHNDSNSTDTRSRSHHQRTSSSTSPTHRYPLRSRGTPETVNFDEPRSQTPNCSAPQQPPTIRSLLSKIEYEDLDLESSIVCEALTRDTDLQPFVDSPIHEQPDTVVSLKDYGEKMEFLGSPVENSEEDDAKEEVEETPPPKEEAEETPPPWNNFNMQDFEITL